ncbi:MAG TPA: glycoside hydrolase family 30 beta sandwich domain-containing protein [Paludibacter sp.]|jgi:glucosylceramidase|nr:MAG: O-Glycosyl hydrolase family 30 [Bacteroidetes bacterium ADurb.Bin174]HQB28639.1 glycoside hydrolase family 30 beta sandwich domain-containing protein [Paludibacter sp.]
MRKIVNYLYIIALLLTFVGCTSCEGGNGPDNNKPDEKETKDVSTYVTTGDKTMLFSAVSKSFGTGINMNIEKTLTLKPEQTFQTIDGFGAAITGSSCYNLLKMSKEDRAKLLEESFSPDKGMGYSYIRVSIGCSDFSLDEYTCCDEPGIENFAMHPYDVRDIYPILREILAINPKIKIMGSPWTPPRWMKVNNLTDLQPYNSWTSGQLNPKYYQDYATYFVKWIQAMEKAGFPIESITIQNEPLNRGNSVSLYMTWQEQRDFIKTALGPKFAEANLKTKIIVFDHNFNYDNISDQQDYPLKIYEDPEAAKYIDGAAYHAYGGSSSEFTKIHNARPDKNLYFTEMSIGTWNYHSFEGDLMWTMKEIGIGALNRHCKAVIVWNYMLDDNRGPNRPGGCTTCYGAVDINSSDYKTLDRKSHYYFIGHMSKVLLPGSLRIGTSGYVPSGVYATAALNPDGTYGIVLQNENATSFQMTIEDENHHFDITLPGKSLTSCIWKK